MRIDTQWQRHGKKLYLLGVLLLVSCRTDIPPKIEICIMDGFGGGDCVEAGGAKLYRTPSQMLNYWSTNQPDEANYTSWCYGSTPSVVNPAMELVRAQALR